MSIISHPDAGLRDHVLIMACIHPRLSSHQCVSKETDGDILDVCVQVCASNFGEVCNVVGVQNSEEILVSLGSLGRNLNLCVVNTHCHC